ncbi:alpha/beta hydrolase family protein [Patulibacter minatonensis]|uniref:alpha/beta hydrolase family protein n=1 Tax=Patulibacter minatonensis TaxID=298163 RepID=UPI00047B5C6D|nr:prolyl oligopeptidase family serine peptidase [Patulibacter minatonensis]
MRRLAILAACSALALPLTACGGDEIDVADSGVPPAEAAAPAAAATTDAVAATRAAERIPKSRLAYPTAVAPRSRPRGLLFVIHGGGWGPSTNASIKEAAAWGTGYQKQGWAAYTISMHSGPAGIEDAVAAYDRNRRRFGPKVPFCAIGASSGGNVALMLAARRPAMRCVIANAPPTDLARLYRESPGNRNSLARLFPGRLMQKYSPIRFENAIKARLFLTVAANDTDVPPNQGTNFYRVHKQRTTLTILPPGDEFWTHSNVDADALDATFPKIDALLDSVARAAGR